MSRYQPLPFWYKEDSNITLLFNFFFLRQTHKQGREKKSFNRKDHQKFHSKVIITFKGFLGHLLINNFKKKIIQSIVTIFQLTHLTMSGIIVTIPLFHTKSLF